MYVSTPSSPQAPGLKASVTALRPETGEVIWKYKSDRNIHGRGLAYWPGDETHAPRLIFGTDVGFLMAVDVTTGQLARDFGRNGAIDAYVGVASEVVGETRRATWTVPNPVMVYKNLIITGSRPGEASPPAPRGDIRAWDARTGRLVWSFHTVPQPGEANYETYPPDEWRDISGANVWSTMALDVENGIVFAPVGDLNARAEGPELYSNSLLALDANTGKLKWFRQITHKDLWDWDLPTPPVLLDVKKDGRAVPAVLLTGKQGLLFLFDRLTGEALNGFNERPTPRTDVEGLDPWPTQPFPDAPDPLARVTMTRNEIPDLVPGMKAACQKIWDDNAIQPGELYSLPQTDRTILSFPSSTGGPNWGGGAYSPELNMYFINVQNRARLNLPEARASGMAGRPRSTEVLPEQPSIQAPGQAGGSGTTRRRAGFSFEMADGTVLPCSATPWGELVGVDLTDLRIAWRTPLGDFAGVPGKDTGTYNLGGSMVTSTGVVFVGASNDKKFRAFDARTGRKLWETSLEASAHATPISYVGADGRQYVVIAAGGGTSVGGPTMSDTLVAFALPTKR
jgi:quinoprotein glucose dehydrogenase